MSGTDTHGEAVARCEEELRHSPLDASVALGFHRTLVGLGELERADVSLREACRGFPHDRRLRFLLIDVLLRRGDNAGAMALIESAMADFGIDDGILGAALSVRSKLDPCAGTEAPRVSLCMIVKDEAGNLARCLHSAKPIVDEIVVIDTGSRDRSADIARAFGARLYDRPWRDDFSDARNAAIANASGDWILVLDADEVVSAQDFDRLRPLLAAPPTCAYRVRTRNYTRELNTVGWRPNTGEYAREEAGAGWFPSEKVRLFPRAPGIVFRHPVHELVEPSLQEAGIPILTCELQVHHYGHLEVAQRTRKTGAYAEIEQQKLRQSSDRSASLREAAIQAARLGRSAEALDLWSRFLIDHPDSPEAYVNMGATCLALGRADDALRCAESALRCAPAMREARVNLALAALHCGDAARAVAVLEPLIAQAPDYVHARFLLAAAYACAGEPERCAATIEPIGATALGPMLPVSFRELARTLAAAGQEALGRRLMKCTPRQPTPYASASKTRPAVSSC
ncbi:MAG TPA: glycosyltransferase [Desulfobacterales bacterium]|nr:glycosyltransferase [Desulfobacterales bacterium]